MDSIIYHTSTLFDFIYVCYHAAILLCDITESKKTTLWISSIADFLHSLIGIKKVNTGISTYVNLLVIL